MTTSTPTTQTTSSVADLFLAALIQRDFATMTTYLAPEVTLRGLIPPGPFTAVGPDPAIERFRGWFGGPDDFTVVDSGRERIGNKLGMHWLVRMRPANGATRVAEQRVFLTTDNGEITGIDLLCSGWQPGDRA
ncbi:nuclear transport factor 2 family protein [Nocardia sp. PE-7]|uniref:nuclear transport factor 2 family protein n=1 Tax=Nocardia sp. PE-7 TaxID=3058426 RepID=UPI00265A130A|nr:nuclear transport factor 2 family protein [Nocardia sp. PE-7]WKG07390.1 nuclear transport factor 2 family protein [Nocardia sp. PE-7]